MTFVSRLLLYRVLILYLFFFIESNAFSIGLVAGYPVIVDRNLELSDQTKNNDYSFVKCLKS